MSCDRTDPVSHLPLLPRDHAILVLLGEEPMHGYALLDHLLRLPGAQIRVGAATLYRTLDRMEEAGIVEPASEHVEQGAGPPRIPYRLTVLGRAVLAAETERLAGMVARVRAGGSSGKA